MSEAGSEEMPEEGIVNTSGMGGTEMLRADGIDIWKK